MVKKLVDLKVDRYYREQSSRKHPKPAFTPAVLNERWSLRPWWHGANPNRHKAETPARLWYLMPKGSRWDGHHHASIQEAPSGEAYIVGSMHRVDDAFTDWDRAVDNALMRADNPA